MVTRAPTRRLALEARGLKPVGVLAEGKPHGVRLRYLAGCRCADCRKANSSYENERQKARRAGDWNGIVDAAKARAHLKALLRLGVGKRAVRAATDIGKSILQDIRAGRKQRIRARTERLILRVGAAQRSDGALIPAVRTWSLIDALVEEGYTVPQLIKRLGYKNRALQLGRERVTVRNAGRVERLYRELTA